MKKLIGIILVGMMIFLLCACDTFSVSQAEEHMVAENLCIRYGDDINSEGEIVLNGDDFVSIAFSTDKQQSDVLNVFFEITDEGKEKFSEATKKAAEASGYLSLWVGDEEISASKVPQQITDNQFVLGIGGVEDKEESQSLIDKLQGISEE